MIIAIAIFVWIVIFIIIILPIYYSIREVTNKQKQCRCRMVLRKFSILRRVGMLETSKIILERAYEK